MPGPPRLGAQARRTRSAILAAAETLFAERGFEAARLEDVAEAVGIRRASIVYYFPDKAALYEAVLAEVLGAFLERMRDALSAPVPLAERIEAAVGAWVDFVGARPTLARLLLREVADAGSRRAGAFQAQIGSFFELVQKLREEVRDDPLAKAASVDPAHLAATIAGATVFFVAAMPSLVPSLGFDPLSPERLAAHRDEVMGIARRLLAPDDVRRSNSRGRRPSGRRRS